MSDIQEEFEDLTSEFLFGIITPEKETRLKNILKSSPEFELKFKGYLKLHSRIMNTEEIWENENQVPEKKIIKFHRKHLLYGALAAAAVFFAVTVFFPPGKRGVPVQENSVSYFSRVLNFYSDCTLNGRPVKIGLEIQDKFFSLKSGKHSYCRTESAGGHRIVLELEPESEIQVALRESSAEVTLLKGKLKIDSEKIQNHSVLIAKIKELRIEFLGTRLLLQTESEISSLTVLKGAVKAFQTGLEDRIISENRSEKFNHSGKIWSSLKISDSETARLKAEFDELNPLSPDELRKGNYSEQPIKNQYSRRVSESINAKKMSQISGKKVRLKNGKVLDAETIFQEDERYIIITKDDIFNIKDSEVDAILFQ